MLYIETLILENQHTLRRNLSKIDDIQCWSFSYQVTPPTLFGLVCFHYSSNVYLNCINGLPEVQESKIQQQNGCFLYSMKVIQNF